MYVHIVFSIVGLLPHCLLALVLLAPQDSHMGSSDDLVILEVDDSLTNQSTLYMPSSNLERTTFPFEWDDITLRKDIMKNRKHHSRHHKHRRDDMPRTRRKKSIRREDLSFSIRSDNKNSMDLLSDTQQANVVHTSDTLFKQIADEALFTLTVEQQNSRPPVKCHNCGENHRRRTSAASSSSSSSTSSKSPSSSTSSSSVHKATSGTSSSLSQGSKSQANSFIYKNGGPLSQENNTTATESLNNASGYTRNDTLKSRERRWAPRLKRVKLSQLISMRSRLSRPVSMGSGMGQPIILRKRNRVEAKVGVLVVVENSIYRQYLLDNANNPRVALARLRRYYGIVFSMIDERFQTINDPYLSITVKISGILVAESREDSSWLEHIVEWDSVPVHGRGSVHTDRALRKFTKWVSSRTDLPEYDHAMVFTAYRLTNRQGVGLGGMAYLNAICDTQSGNAVSIVADRGDFQCVKVATHELAHSLGASHDGDRQSKTCPPDSNFIMSPLTSHDRGVLKNAFYFSPCSIRDMSYHLSKSSSSCVKNEPKEYYRYDLQRLPPGRIYSADMQCKLVFGKKSELCREGNLVNIMCGQLWCRDPEKENGCRTNSYLTALPGTECAPNRICHLGECIIDTSRNIIQRTPLTSSINIIPSIPQPARPSFRIRRPRRRDRESRRSKLRTRSSRRNRRRRRRNRCTEDKNPKYCQGLIRLNPGGCKRRAIRQYCCQTCRRLRRRRRR